MKHKLFRLFFVLTFVLGLAIVSTPQAVRAAGPWYVSTTGNDDNDCLSPTTQCATINEPLKRPNFVAGDIILVAIGTYTGTGSEVVLIDKDVTLSGGWDETFTSQTGMSTIDGQNTRRGIYNAGVPNMNYVYITMSYFHIMNGNGSINGGYGGGIFNQSGMLTFNNSKVSGNSALDLGGGIFNANSGTMMLTNITVNGNSAGLSGAGIANFGTLTLNNSTISDNSMIGNGNNGGGITNEGTLTLTNSTVSGNKANYGGGIANSGTLTLNNSTVSGNTGIYSGGSFSGGGIYSPGGITTLNNTIVSNNTAGNGPDCFGTITSNGYNIIGNTSGCTVTPGIGDQFDADPMLNTFLSEQGYYPLLLGSPAIDTGDNSTCLNIDQRGVNRPQGIACDIGAYEYTTPGPAASLSVVNGSGQRAGTSSVFSKPLQAAALDSQGSPVSGVTIDFTAPASGASGTFADTGTNTTSVNTDTGGVATAPAFTANDQVGAYTVSASAPGLGSVNFSLRNGDWYVTTTGNDSNSCSESALPCATINGVLNKPDFVAGDTVRVAIGTYTGTGYEVVLLDKDATLSGGWDDTFTTQTSKSTIDGQGARRGITVHTGATVTIRSFTVQNGFDCCQGAGIFNTGTLTITDSVIKANRTPSGDGGGVWNGWDGISASGGTLTLNHTSIFSNVGGSQGGGIFNLQNSSDSNQGGNVTLNYSTIRDNSAWGGGGIRSSSSYGIFELTLNNSTVSGNTAIYNGGGIWFDGKLTLNNSTVSGNTANADGGGIYNGNQFAFTLNNSTVSANTAGGRGGGILAASGTASLENSLIAGNTATSGGPDCGDSINSIGYNIIGDTSGCTLTPASHDQFNVNPQLGTFLPIQGYHPLLAASPAINAGNPATCFPTDQRGVARVGTCDIGAYEYTTPGSATTLSVVGGDNQSTTTTLAFPKPLQAAALDSQGSPVSGVNIDFTAPMSGSSGTFADTGANTTSANTDAGGVATTSVFTANDQGGAYIVSAATPGLGSVSFNLEQISRPVNDNFANAKPITSLPFTATADITNATNEPNEPQWCYSVPNTVWYSFTPTANALVKADMVGSSFSDTIFNVYQLVGSGFNGLSFMQCVYYGNSATFSVQAGVTYYIQAGSISNSGGDLHLNLQEIPRPGNADFANAVGITQLPFSATPDITNGGIEPNEPEVCYYMPDTVWYSFTPTENTLVRANTDGSAISSNINVYKSNGSGISNLTNLGCTIYNGPVTFLAEAGQTYYLQAGGLYGQTGTMSINLEQLPLPANDDFAKATPITSLPSSLDLDTTWATFQSNEPSPSCAYPYPPYKTVWFAYTATQTGSISASVPGSNFSPFIAAYSGTGFGNLTQLGCSQYSNIMTFHVVSGQTYYFQAGGFYGGGGTGQFFIQATPAPQAYFYNYPGDPSKYDTIQFYDGSYDPGQVGFQTYTWNFGDGATATGSSPTHKYAADGNYQVTHTVTTVDGRTASVTQTLQVRTHDVAITKLTTPNSANVGQTKTITVTLRNVAYPETVQIDLYKSTANGFVLVGTVTKSVPALSGNRTTAVNFSYKFTSDDAKLGKVTFKAVATIIGARDAYPSDNEAISSITKVAK